VNTKEGMEPFKVPQWNRDPGNKLTGLLHLLLVGDPIINDEGIPPGCQPCSPKISSRKNTPRTFRSPFDLLSSKSEAYLDKEPSKREPQTSKLLNVTIITDPNLHNF
jgi:hypothetical protein